MRNRCWLLLVLSLVLAVGCHETDDTVNPSIPAGAMTYTGYDEQGTPVVQGWVKPDIAIIAVDPAFPMNLTGTWKLWRVGVDGELGPQIGEGTLEGSLGDTTLFVNFNPGRADDNVVADGAFEVIGGPRSGMRWEGTWTWNTLAGPRRTGTFRARG